MKLPNRTYHHGDLKTAVIQAGQTLLKDCPIEGLSLRELARRVGVSPTALYRHFPDKQALVQALCEEGRSLLGQAQKEAFALAGGGQAGLDATGMAYVEFAVANSTLFRLMTQTQPLRESGAPDKMDHSVAMQVLKSNVQAMLPQSASEYEKKLRTIRAWALVHGIAMLVLEGRLEYDKPTIEAVIRMPVP